MNVRLGNNKYSNVCCIVHTMDCTVHTVDCMYCKYCERKDSNRLRC